MKGTSYRNKLIITFLVADLIILLVIVQGYLFSNNQLAAENPVKYTQNYHVFMGAMLFIAIVFMGITTISFIRGFRIGFEKVSKITHELTAGNLDVDMGEIKNDEFGRLILDYKKLIEAQKEEAELAEAVANGDLTITITPRSDKDQLGYALKKMVAKNQNALSNINESAYQVMTSSSQVASASEALAQGSTEQASAIEEITSSITDIAEKTKVNATNATEASELMHNAIDYVNRGNEQMEGMMSAMDDINKSSESISKIIKVIDDIAFQTNILALNAAVEAARAGDAGKGFAVVADEIRKLADQSMQSANSIRKIILDIQEQSQTTADSAKEAESIVSSQETALHNAVSAFQDINRQVISLTGSLEAITSRMQTMEHAKSSTLEAIKNMSDMSKETLSTSQKMSQTIGNETACVENLSEKAKELSTNAQTLETTLAYFKV